MGRGRQAWMRTVFVDSSVLFTAVASPTGGSAKLFTLKKFQLVTSLTVLAEVERNVKQKLMSFHLTRFFLLVGKMSILSQRPNLSLIKKTKKVIVEKDAVILAEAKQAKTDILVTLDRKHFFIPRVKKFLTGQKIVTPKLLIERETEFYSNTT